MRVLTSYRGVKNKILVTDDRSFHPPVNKNILVTGCPRSGTTSYTEALRAHSIDAPHEVIGLDGTVSCFFYFPAVFIPFEKWEHHYKKTQVLPDNFNDYEFTLRVHLIRYPLDCISSMLITTHRSEYLWDMYHNIIEREFILKKEIKIRLLMQKWINQNKIIETLKPLRVRIEDQEKGFKKVLNKLGFKMLDGFVFPRKHAILSTSKSKRITEKFKKLDWKDLERIDGGMCETIMKMSKRYGY